MHIELLRVKGRLYGRVVKGYRGKDGKVHHKYLGSLGRADDEYPREWLAIARDCGLPNDVQEERIPEFIQNARVYLPQIYQSHLDMVVRRNGSLIWEKVPANKSDLMIDGRCRIVWQMRDLDNHHSPCIDMYKSMGGPPNDRKNYYRFELHDPVLRNTDTDEVNEGVHGTPLTDAMDSAEEMWLQYKKDGVRYETVSQDMGLLGQVSHKRKIVDGVALNEETR